ncbi:MAG: M48 family metallopeptidase [Terracidiphilus sp.]
MTYLRRFVLVIGLSAFVAGVVSAPLSAQTTGSPAAPAPTVSAAPAPTVSATPAPAPANPQQAYTLPPDKLANAITLNRIRNILEIGGSVWGIVFVGLLLAFGAWAGLERWVQGITGRRWVQGPVFFAAYFVITALASLPLDLIGHHYERAYGISVQGWGSWFWDLAKAMALTLLFGTPILLLFNWIVRKWPRRYWLGLWVVTLPILVFAIFVSPFLEPIFYKFEPLAKNHAGLVTELEKVVARTGTNIPPDRMFLMKASVKSNGLNAYVSGIGATKRIVVWDTTAGRVPDDEVLFIFGHESGHYVLRHIPKIIAGYAVGLFFVYWACAAFTAWLVKRFGGKWGAQEPASRTGLMVLLFAISIASFLLEPASNAFSRHFEHQADVYGQEAIHGIVADPQMTAVAAFNALGEAWLEDPNPNPIIEFWLYNHPSVQHRANFALHYDPWANGGYGEFFYK